MSCLFFIRAKQSLHSLSYVTPSVPQTGSYVWGQAGDSAMCSQMGILQKTNFSADTDTSSRVRDGKCEPHACSDHLAVLPC